MPLPRKSFKDTQALSKEAKSSTAPLDAQPTNVLSEVEKARLTTSPTIPSSKLPKDARAYEHERQRLRKAADFVKMRARKAQQGAGWAGTKAHHRTGSGRSYSGSTTPSEKGGRLREEDAEEDEGEGLVLSDSWKENLGVTTVAADQPRYEVKLADLIRPGKPRKPKGSYCLPQANPISNTHYSLGDSDFEVIPHIRSVIALDDNTPDELDVDEPWEHIYNTDSEDNKELSYAQVVALSK